MSFKLDANIWYKRFWGVVFLLGPIIGASQDMINFEHITTDNGLSQSDINAIYQDKKGFMWFATHDGLNKYDGYDFTIYKPQINQPESISSNLIFDIVGDQDDNLWIGTTGKGLNYFNRSTEKFIRFQHDENNKGSLSSDHVIKVLLDSKNRLWVGTSKGLNMLDLKKMKDSAVFEHFYPEINSNEIFSRANSINSLYEDDKGHIWTGTAQGLFKISRDKNGDQYLQSVNEAIGLPKTRVECIGSDNFGRLLIGTGNGVYVQMAGPDSTKIQKFHEGDFNKLLVDNNNHIWFGTNEGLLYFKNTNKDNVPILENHFKYDSRNKFSLSKNIVKSLFLDKTGIIWIGTNGGGVNKYDPERKQFRHVRKSLDPNSLSYDKIRSMYEDSNGTLWIGTEGGGLNMLKKEYDDGTYNNFRVFDNIQRTFALTEAFHNDRKILFVGAENEHGLYILDITNPNRIKEENIIKAEDVDTSVFSLLTDSQNNIWIGTYGGGVQRWVPNKDSKQYTKDVFINSPSNPSSLPSNIVRNIYEDSHGNIWFGTGDGLGKLSLDQKGKKQPNFTVYKNDPKNPGSISHNYILAIRESTAGDLWVGTFGGGLNKLVQSDGNGLDSFISYTETDGLPNNVIKGILEDNMGYLWLSTNQGLSKFNPKEVTFKNYDVNDGLQNNEFQELAALKRKDGEMLFGGINGFNTFYPEKITENSFEAETVITNFSISNKPVKIDEEINGRVILNKSIEETKELHLKYGENNFSFEFASIHYAAPEKNVFAYMLEGFDKGWIQTSSEKRFATYTNIEPGWYTLKVKASNNDGIWDSSPSEVRIRVIPPWWRTNSAYALYTLLFLGMLWLFWRYTFISTTKKHQLELEYLEKEKAEELQRIKLEFFTNISHEFKTPLTLIKGPLEYLQKNVEKLEKKIVLEQYGLMYKNTNYLMRLINQLLDFRKINQGKMHLVVRHGNVLDFVKVVAEPFQFLARKQSIDFKIISEQDKIMSWFDQDALEKILNNLLSNAFKFTPENGTISIKISEERELDTYGILKAQPLNLGALIIQVQDSGIGITPDRMDSIFKRFYVEKDDKKLNPEGAGIGLSFTKSLVELHQGKIDIISEPNKGANFIVRLPIEKVAYENNLEITCKEVNDSDYSMRSTEAEYFAIGINDEMEDSNISKSRSKLPVLLVVDDNADIRAFIKQTLGDSYTVYEAENGEVGLQVANKLIPNIILTDVIMPVMDGIELCGILKSKKETSHIPIVMLTAKSSEESEIEGLIRGADDYISKPFSIDSLRLKLTNIIKTREELRKRFNRDITLNPTDVTVTSADETFLQLAMDTVEKHMMNTDFSVEMLVKEMGISRSNLYLKFKELTGLSSSEFIRNIRLKRAVQLLEKSDMSVKEIMYMTGFNTASYFSKCFKKQFGVIPSEYLEQQSLQSK